MAHIYENCDLKPSPKLQLKKTSTLANAQSSNYRISRAEPKDSISQNLELSQTKSYNITKPEAELSHLARAQDKVERLNILRVKWKI